MAAQRFLFSSGGSAAGPAEAKRLAHWFERFCSAAGGRDYVIDWDRPFAADFQHLAFDRVAVSRSSGTMEQYGRRKEHIARDRDDRFALLVNRGPLAIRFQTGAHEVSLSPGCSVLVDFSEPARYDYPGEFSVFALYMPRRLLCGAVGNAEDLAVNGAIIPADNQAVRLLIAHGAALADEAIDDPVILQRAGGHLVDLAVLALGAGNDHAAAALLGGARAARLAAILRQIRIDYADPEITPRSVAARIGVSTRYLHTLLQETGTSFSERVQELRLARALMLLAGSDGPIKISDAAYRAGFNDLSHFNRLFRRRYGMTPTAARGHGDSAARQGDDPEHRSG